MWSLVRGPEWEGPLIFEYQYSKSHPVSIRTTRIFLYDTQTSAKKKTIVIFVL